MNKADVSFLLTRPIAFHASLARLCGGATEGIFISQALYWSDKGRDPEGWFYKTADEWQEETCLTRREQETARKRLVSLGILQEVKRGLPCKLFYRIDFDVLSALIHQAESPPSEPPSEPQSVQTRLSETANKPAASDRPACQKQQASLSQVTNWPVTSDRLLQRLPPETTPETTQGTVAPSSPRALFDMKAAPLKEPKGFVPPTLEECLAHFAENGWQASWAKQFWGYWESLLWKRGNRQMTKWKAAAFQWSSKELDKASQELDKAPPVSNLLSPASSGERVIGSSQCAVNRSGAARFKAALDAARAAPARPA